MRYRCMIQSLSLYAFRRELCRARESASASALPVRPALGAGGRPLFDSSSPLFDSSAPHHHTYSMRDISIAYLKLQVCHHKPACHLRHRISTFKSSAIPRLRSVASFGTILGPLCIFSTGKPCNCMISMLVCSPKSPRRANSLLPLPTRARD